jgi:REP element-mobilizing transposase RayT
MPRTFDEQFGAKISAPHSEEHRSESFRPDTIYHVINRGNYRSDIFRSDGAREAFLKCLGEACGQAGWAVHAWCLMSNH